MSPPPVLAPERRRRLLDLIRREGTVLVTDLERKLAVSRMTIYRDLDVLEAEGAIERVHGGVVARETAPASGNEAYAQPLVARLSVERGAKRAIATHLAELLARVRTALVDNSSTALGVAATLQPRAEDELFLVTGSVALFLDLQRRKPAGVRVVLHGGEPQARTGTLVGPFALASLHDARFDIAIVSCVGVMEDEDAVFVSNQEEAELKRAYLAVARHRVLAFDTTKRGRSGPFVLAKLSEFDSVVTQHGVTSRKGTRSR